MLQAYETRVADGFVLSGNDALVVCSLPSHTAQFLQVAAWVTSEGAEIIPRLDPSSAGHHAFHCLRRRCAGFLNMFSGQKSQKRRNSGESSYLGCLKEFMKLIPATLFSAILQSYLPITGDHHVMLGNAVLIECRVPAHVADVVFVASWLVQELGFPDMDLSSANNPPHGLFCSLTLTSLLSSF